LTGSANEGEPVHAAGPERAQDARGSRDAAGGRRNAAAGSRASADVSRRAAGPDWVRDAVFYQIFPDRFAASARVRKPGELEPWDAPPTIHGFKGGDLLGIAEHLDDLRALGVTALYLTPVFASASNHRYHTFDYETVDPLLGGDAALRELLDEAHARDMRVILDGVFNHASRGFWPFHHILENGIHSPYRDWFHLDPDVLAGRRGLTAYPGHADTDAGLGYRAWWDLPALPTLNHSNPAVRDYIYGIAERWLRFGIDGWRLDVPEEIDEPGFWEEFRRRSLAVNPDAYLVGEIWNPAPEWLAADPATGRFHGLMNYPLAEAILSFVGAGRLDEELVAKTYEYARNVRPIDGPEFGRQLQRIMTTYEPAVSQLQLNLLDSHDTPRFLSLAGGDRSALRLATLIQMTLPGAPCIYYGDEIGLEGREDPDCRRSYPWDPARQDAALRSFVAGLIALRKSEPALRRGRFRLLQAEGSAADSAAGSTIAYALDFEGADDFEGQTEDESSRGARGSAGSRPDAGRPTERLSVESRPAGHSIVVAVNAADVPNRICFQVPRLAGHRVEQVSWPGSDWTAAFAPTTLREGTLALEMEARAGMVLKARPDF
jgi:neopullulanase